MTDSIKLASASILVKYFTRHLSPTEKVRFHYALKGRHPRPGILKETQSQALAKGVIVAPLKNEKALLDFFKIWRCPVEVKILHPPLSNELVKTATAFKKQHKAVSDILLISSKEIYILLNSPKPQQIISAFKKQVRGYTVSYFQTSELFKPENKKWLDLFSKGISLTSPKPKRKHHCLFLYSTTKLSPTDKVRFYYALKGRDGKSGALKQTASEFLAKGVILVPIEQASVIEDLLRTWRCEPRKMEVIVESSHE